MDGWIDRQIEVGLLWYFRMRGHLVFFSIWFLKTHEFLVHEVWLTRFQPQACFWEFVFWSIWFIHTISAFHKVVPFGQAGEKLWILRKISPCRKSTQKRNKEKRGAEGNLLYGTPAKKIFQKIKKCKASDQPPVSPVHQKSWYSWWKYPLYRTKTLGYLENFFATVVALKAAEGTLAVGIQNIQKKQGDMVTPNLLRQVVKDKKLSKDHQIKQLCLWLEPWFCLPCSSPVWHRGLLQAAWIELSDDPWGDLPSPRSAHRCRAVAAVAGSSPLRWGLR